MNVSLNSHPVDPLSWEFPPGAKTTITSTALKYRDALPTDSSLQIEHPAGEAVLKVELNGQFDGSGLRVQIGGEECHSGELRTGDLLILGRYAWIFRAYATGQGVGLEPIDPLPGVGLTLTAVKVGNRLNIPDLHIPAGQSVAIIGRSGAGKSTLIRELVEQRKGKGDVEIGGVLREWPHDPASYTIAYLPQTDLVHEDLTLRQQTESFISLSCNDDSQEKADESLRAVGLFEQKNSFPENVSGGQLRRARFASALGRNPGVLLLDEPDSGLDPETAEEIYRLIKTFDLLGCTVLMVTHHRHGLDNFDRILELKNGEIAGDSLPSKSATTEGAATFGDNRRMRGTSPSGSRQLSGLLKREFRKQWNRKFISWNLPFKSNTPFAIPQWLLNLVLIPILFGISIAIVSPTGDDHELQPYLVAFLCSLSFIWIAASNSYLSLTSEWNRIQYEIDQGLFPYLYLLSKSVVLLLTVLIQSLSFWLALGIIRYKLMDHPILYGHQKTSQTSPSTFQLGSFWYEHFDCGLLWMIWTMVAVGWAASQMGLMISALAKNRTHVATSILPLVMMLQVLFSVFVIRAAQSDQSLQSSYEGFYLTRTCEGAIDCPSHNLKYFHNTALLCSSCIEKVEDRLDEVSQYSLSSDENQSLWEQSIADVQAIALTEEEICDRRISDEYERPPNIFATAMTYGTLTRYADISIRPYALSRCDVCSTEGEVGDENCENEADEDAENYSYRVISWFGFRSLIGFGLGFHFITALIIGAVRPGRSLGRLVARASSHTATKLLVLVVLVFYCSSTLSAEEASESEKPAAIHVMLPVQGNQYDASAVLSRDSRVKSQAPVWYQLTPKTHLALALMKSQGIIESYSVDDKRIHLVVIEDKWKPLSKSLSPPRLIGTDQSRKHDKLVVLVHGLEGGLGSYQNLAPAFEAEGWFPLQLVYPNDAEISFAGNYLKTQLSLLSQRDNQPRIVIVGHSLGGIVSWLAITELEHDHRVTDLVTLGTPFGGSQLAIFHKELEFSDALIKLVKGNWEPQDLDRDGQGEAARLLEPGNPELQKLISRRLPSDVKLHLIAGTSGLIPPDRRQEMIQAMEGIIKRKRLSKPFADELRKLISADECVRGLGDGVVTVKSATLPKNSENVLKVDLSHIDFLSDKVKIDKLVDQICGLLNR